MKSNPNGGKNTPKIHIDAETKTKIELWIVNNIATAEEAKSLNMDILSFPYKETETIILLKALVLLRSSKIAYRLVPAKNVKGLEIWRTGMKKVKYQ